jgi:hypothetical protein
MVIHKLISGNDKSEEGLRIFLIKKTQYGVGLGMR